MSGDKYRVSIIVPTYDRCKLLMYTLKSILTQSMDKSDFELIVVDDGSSDSTFRVVKSFEQKVNLKYVYQTDRGFRPASARNLGIKTAEGNLVVFVDSGTLLAKNCLESHVRFHRNQAEDVAVIGYILGYAYDQSSREELWNSIDPDDAGASLEHLTARNQYLDIREKVFAKYSDSIHMIRMPWTLFWGGHLSVKQKSLLQVGMYDENFDGNWGGEDNDLGYRLHEGGIPIHLCREARVLHLPHTDPSQVGEKNGYKNCRYFHQKYNTPETQLFLDYCVQEVSHQIQNQDVIDFHELSIASLGKSIS
ncbi:MAG: glycosyltransferase [Bacteroidota bacterium]